MHLRDVMVLSAQRSNLYLLNLRETDIGQVKFQTGILEKWYGVFPDYSARMKTDLPLLDETSLSESAWLALSRVLMFLFSRGRMWVFRAILVSSRSRRHFRLVPRGHFRLRTCRPK